jgi:hypothetical protein
VVARVVPCVESAPAASTLPGVGPETSIAYWSTRYAAAFDRVVLDATGIDALDRELAMRGHGGLGPRTLMEPPDPDRIGALVRGRLSAMDDRAHAGELVERGGAQLTLAALHTFDVPRELPPLSPELHFALAPVALHCAPRPEPLEQGDARFDRNLCSTLEPNEPVELLLRWPNGMTLARTPYVIGFVERDASLSPTIDSRAVLASPQVLVTGSHEPLPLVDGAVARPTASGLSSESRAPDAIDLPRALTRRAMFEQAFARLGEPYVWGGNDCSSLTQDLFLAFGLHLPRNSAEQAETGTARIELSARDDDDARRSVIVAAGERGIVLLAFPGHVMLYLGTNDAGEPMVLHALAEYVEPCAGGGETLRLVDRVVVSDLNLGARTSRGSLLSRVTRVVVFGDR